MKKVLKGYVRTPSLDYALKIYDDEKRIIAGYASTKFVDRVNDVVEPEAFKKTMKTYMTNPIVLFNHNPFEAIGTVVAHTIDEVGLWVQVQIGKGYDVADRVWAMIKQGIVRAFSIGFIPKDVDKDKDKDVYVVKDLELLEISVVSIPANREALFAVEGGKAVEIVFDGTDLVEGGDMMDVKDEKRDFDDVETEDVEEFEEKQVAPYRKNQPLDEKSSWDKRKAIRQLRKWASKDGSGAKDQMNWNKYFQGFFYRYDDRKDDFGGYKLPYCYVEDGKVVAVKRGIMAVAAVLQGARGGTNIPEKDQEKIKKVVSKWYKRWGDVAPWDRKDASLTQEEVLALMEDIVSEKALELEEQVLRVEKYVDELATELLVLQEDVKELLDKLIESKNEQSDADNFDEKELVDQVGKILSDVVSEILNGKEEG